MKGDPVPPDHHVLRQCREADLKTEADGRVVGVYPHAFEYHEDGISVTWLEHFRGTPAEQLVAARAAISSLRRLRKSNSLARLVVGKVIEAGRSVRKAVSVIHDPIEISEDKRNTGHSLVKGVGDDDNDLRNRIAMTVSAEDLEPAVPG